MIKKIAVLLTFFVSAYSSFAQSLVGLSLSTNMDIATAQGIDTSNYILGTKQRYGYYPSGYVGALYHIALGNKLALEPQINVGLKGHTYKVTDVRTNITTKGSINMLALHIPLNIILKFPFTKSTGNIHIGFGPYIDYHLSGKQKEKTEGMPYALSKMKFSTTNNFLQNSSGINAFIGFSDADGSTLRLTVQQGMSAMYTSKSAKTFMHSIAISYINMF